MAPQYNYEFEEEEEEQDKEKEEEVCILSTVWNFFFLLNTLFR